MAPSLSHAGPMVSLSRAQALVELERLLAATFTPAELVSRCADLYDEDFAPHLRANEDQSATFMGEAVGLLVRGPLDERLLLSLPVANPALRPEVQGVARGLGFFLSETAIRAFTTPDYELPPRLVELALVDLREQRRRVAEAFKGPITALVALRLQGDRDREALHAAAEALRAWAATNLEHVTLPDVRDALESFVALVPMDPATSLKPFLAAEWLPRIATLRQLGQLRELELGLLAATLAAGGVSHLKADRGVGCDRLGGLWARAAGRVEPLRSSEDHSGRRILGGQRLSLRGRACQRHGSCFENL